MSSILKALKKLEDSKAARPPGSLHIDADILRDDTPRSLSLPGIALAAALLFVCGGGATYLYMKRSMTATPEQPPTPAVAPLPRQVTRDIRPAAQPVAPSPSQVQPNAVIPPAAPPVVQHAAPRPVTPATKKTAAPRRPATPLPSPAVQPTAQAAPAAAPPVVKVNGIAFQGDGASSVAVINGSPVSTGSVIDGVTVEDIQKDRVRFSYGGERFEVGLGRSNR